jgi:hypothetical protein
MTAPGFKSTTILLAQGRDPYGVSVSRAGLRNRLLARARAFELDGRLAAGANPDSSALLSLRARQLESRANRRRLARGFRGRLSVSSKSPHPFDRRVPLARAEIRNCAGLIEELAERLEAPEPADPQGIARASLLLTNGNSPLYTRATELGPALRKTIDQLTVPPTILTAH